MKKLMSANEILDYLGIHLNTMYRLTQRDPTFPAKKIAGKWKADPDQLEAWVNNHPNGDFNQDPGILPMPRIGRPPVSGTSQRRAIR